MSDEVLASILKRSGASGMACAADRQGARPAIWTAGVRARRSQQAVQPTDRWRLGSITKAMTATLAGRLADQGVIGFDATIAQVLGKDFPTLNPAYGSVALWQLFTHRAGMPHDLSVAAMRGNAPVRELVRASLETKPVKRLDTAGASYSNIGVAVAGAMLEARAGRPWRELMQIELFAPLGLASAGFGRPLGDEPQGQWMAGMAAAAMRPLAQFSPAYWAFIAPAGDVHMSLPDLLAFLAAHRDRSILLRPDTWAFLQSDPIGKGVGMGWGISPKGVLAHTGSDGFFYAQVMVDRASGVVAAAAGNRGDLAAPVRRALEGAVAAIQGSRHPDPADQ